MSRFVGPYPNKDFKAQIVESSVSPYQDGVSGEITATVRGKILGVSKFDGRVSKVAFALVSGGSDASHALGLSVDVCINGTTCLSTKPAYMYVSGSPAHVSAFAAGTGITEAIIDGTANDVSVGDVITYDYVITRTASPANELSTLVVYAEVLPL